MWIRSVFILIVSVTFNYLEPIRLSAQEPIRFGRTPDISPDGKQVAFSYLGDIWTVSVNGGVAKSVTMHEAHEFEPTFSPDGKWLAFSSNRHGQYDVFVVPVHGGKPKRLTFHSSHDHVCGWSPDGKHILFNSARALEYPFDRELYQIPATGGKVQRITLTGGRQGDISPDGKEITYVRGSSAWFRKGYHGSANDEIWICGIDGKNHRQLTRFTGTDNYPSWSPDGKSIYYVTDAFGSPANIVCQELASVSGAPLAVKSKPKQITFHKEEGVRQARLSRDGNLLVYECGTDLWVISSQGGQGKKIVIEAFADNKSNTEKSRTFTSGASEFSVSPDEKAIALVVHGEVFLTPRGGGKATRLTDHPANDHGLAWSPDGKRLLFLSDRGGQEDVFEVLPDDPKHPSLHTAHQFKVKQLTSTSQAEVGLNFSPDGKKISFLREGRLITLNANGSEEKIIVNDPLVIDYEWSPDSKWICYSRADGSNASELYIIPSGGATPDNPVRNITRYATYNAYITWSRQGHKIAFLSERGLDAEKNVYVLSLQKPSTPDAKPSNELDWEDIHLRVEKLFPKTASRPVISPGGNMVAFRAGAGSEEDLFVAEVDGNSIKRISKGNMKPMQIQWSNLLSHLVYFRDGSGAIYLGFANGKSDPLKIPFAAKMIVKQEEQFGEIFEQSWRYLYENFYDPQFHGVNWKAVRDRYRPIVKYVAMREDLDALINLMMGELNASHVGIQEPSADQKKPEELTAELGLVFDEHYSGPGLKIQKILPRGPADKTGLKIKEGQYIVKVDGVALTQETNLAKILNGKAGEIVSLHVTNNPPDPSGGNLVEIKATSRSAITPLMYQDWVKAKAALVSKLSEGKFGYIHIPRMDESGLDLFLRALHSENNDKEAIVLDVRFNPGGFVHDKIITYLMGKIHTWYIPRHGTKGTVFRPGDRKWTKPLSLLINNRSFSSAEVFANAFHSLGLGKLVGIPTGGHVIGTGSMTLIDGSTLRIPRIGVFTLKGINMEKKGVEPDVYVEDHPDQLIQGLDSQLQKSVELLKQDVVKANKNELLGPPIPEKPLPGSGAGASPGSGAIEIIPAKKNH